MKRILLFIAFGIWFSFTTLGQSISLLKDIFTPNGSSYPYDTRLVNNAVYFAASDSQHGTEVWKTDGTPSGTYLVKDIDTSNQWGITMLGEYKSLLFFGAYSDTIGNELWKTDGTEAGTVLVKDINPNGNGLVNTSHIVYNNVLYFFATINGYYYLYRTDGTTAGSYPLKQFCKTDLGNAPQEFATMGAAVYFNADDGIHGQELWKSDGTEAGTVMVKDVNLTGSGTSSIPMIAFKGNIYYPASDGTSRDLWATDGTASGTKRIKRFNYDPPFVNVNELTILGNELLFSAANGPDNYELWKTDGTELGTVLVKDIHPTSSSYPSGLRAANNKLYFSATNNDEHELWVTDGTTNGTRMVKDINPQGPSNPGLFCEYNGGLYFSANNATYGNELWKTDGTEIGTSMVFDLNKGTSSSYPSYIIQLNNQLIFGADDGINGWELFQTIFPILSSETENEKYAALRISPNPFDESFGILSANPLYGEASITDLAGKVIDKIALTGIETITSLQAPSGIYYLKLKNESESLCFKIVKK